VIDLYGEQTAPTQEDQEFERRVIYLMQTHHAAYRRLCSLLDIKTTPTTVDCDGVDQSVNQVVLLLWRWESMSLDVPDRSIQKLIVEAAFDPAKWTGVCDSISRAIGGYGSLIFPLGPEHAKMGLPHSASLEESFQHYIKDDWHKRDLRFKSLELMRQRSFATDADCISHDEIAVSPYYQEFLRPNKLKWFAGIGIGSGADFWVLSIQQTLDKDPFAQSDIQKIMSYREVLNNAANISRQLGYARISAAAHIMEQHGRAIIALGFEGRVVHVSTLAQKYLGKAFHVVQGRLNARHDNDRAPFEALIASLCSNNVVNAAGKPIPLQHDPDEAPLVIYGTVLPEQERQIFYRATALLMIVDPNLKQNTSAGLLMDYYDVTKAEAKLAVSLLNGKTVEHHSLQIGISPVTARNHLQGLLRKTGSHSKAELIAKLNKISPI
jgi:DNA-binding CsgD family transcriptional regulator